MLFNTWIFWAFFAVVLAGYFAVPRGVSRLFLVGASLVFYASWDWRFLGLLAGYTVFNYATGRLIGAAGETAARRLLWGAVAVNLALLSFFKYWLFIADNISRIFDLPAGFSSLHIILPVGISFYTFEAISYNIDVRRGAVEPRRNFLDFALFMSFFPRLVAGPIIRPAHFFPQVGARRVPSGEDIAWGVMQIVKGLIKKAVLADNFALLADAYFGTRVGQGPVLAAWVGVLAFTVQIYFDFAGYTDIARGCARLLGFDLPENFDRPYLAANIAAFWRRWHISLSTWLRDYLYIPLGGSRGGQARTNANLMITMALGGLWHGASWNFMIWGVYHGLLLCGYHAVRRVRIAPAVPGRVGTAAAVGLTFLAVVIGWVPFRAADLGTTIAVLGDLVAGGWQGFAVPAAFWWLLGCVVAWNLADHGRRLQDAILGAGGWRGRAARAGALALALMVLQLFAVTDLTVPFIYFQF